MLHSPGVNPGYVPSQSCTNWSGKRDSNPRPRAWKARALPTELFPQNKNGGEGRIRTFEGIAGRFTVCSLWPLGNLSPSLCNHNFASARPSRTLLRQLDRFSLELAIGFEPTTC